MTKLAQSNGEPMYSHDPIWVWSGFLNEFIPSVFIFYFFYFLLFSFYEQTKKRSVSIGIGVIVLIVVSFEKS